MKNPEATTIDAAATVAEQGAHVAPEKAPSKKGASQKKGAPKGQKTAKGAKAKAAPKKASKKAAKPARKKEASAPRAESKGAKILEMIGRAKGATLTEIMKATAQAVADILNQRFKRRDTPAVAVNLLGLLDATQLDQRLAAGFDGCHAGPQIVLDVQVEMAFQFVGQLAFPAAVIEQTREADEESAHVSHRITRIAGQLWGPLSSLAARARSRPRGLPRSATRQRHRGSAGRQI